MTRLADDILSLILELSCLDVVTLWLTGDTTLQARLLRACTAVRTSPALSTLKLRRWPRIISRFRSLRALDINVRNIKKIAIEDLVTEIKRLPPTLTELKLFFPGAPRIPVICNGGRQGSILPLQTAHREGPKVQVTYWNVKKHFPLLRKVAFVEKKEAQFIPLNAGLIPLSTASFSIFPPGLLELQWTGKLESTTNLLALPRDLTVLNFSKSAYNHLSISAVEHLPPALTYLNGVTILTIKSLDRLPKTLRSGDWINGPLLKCTPQAMPRFLRSLPPATQSILGKLKIQNGYFTKLGTWWASMLPSTLTELHVEGRTLYSKDIELLPRTLLRLVNVSLDYTELFERSEAEGGTNFWPPQLASIWVEGHTGSASASMFTLFPPSLTELRGIRVSLGTCILSSAEKLPSRLAVFNARYPDFKEVFLRVPLPPTLRELELENVSISPQSFSMLPRHLVRLTARDTSLAVEKLAPCMTLLPNTLEYLNLGVVQRAALLVLPPNLTTLYAFKIIGNFYDQHIQSFPRSLKLISLPAGVTVYPKPSENEKK